ncbi:LysR family transcriptional regulator [Streptomyces adustus]|uniref:LysR family transcriptional regulator n=1 Tax=Streptomyces adustus TaxID=1609272 RepID=A0A5N8VLC2_9ACTN|nr:LysR family transcriptional regulator [Streptomyces adustus]
MPSDLPDLHALELLVAVAETGSLSQAAARFAISQPSASARMMTLERRLGVKLLLRTTRGSRLTPAGLVVTDWARGVLESAAAFVEGTAALRSRQEGRLRVGASLTVAEHLVPGWLLALRESAPHLHVGLEVSNSRKVIEGLRHDTLDVGFVEGPCIPRDLRSTVVGRDRLLVVVTPDHPWAHRSDPVPGGELAATALVLREPGSGTRETLETALEPYGGVATPLLELGAIAPLRSAAASGVGPAVLSAMAVQDDLAEGRLVSVPTEAELRLDRVLQAVWPRGRSLPAQASQLLALACRRPGRRPSGS